MKPLDGRINGSTYFKQIISIFVFMYYITVEKYCLTLATITTKKPAIWPTIPMVMQSISALDNEQTTYPEMQSIVGSSVALPCNMTLSSPSDAVKLILWYRGGDISGTPIYSIDARTTPLASAQHFMSETLDSRARTDPTVHPLVLRIDPIVETDDGQYWCRVDFRWTRTAISVVTLNVIEVTDSIDNTVPPYSVVIRNSNGDELSEYATGVEDENLTLVCESYGGKPLPALKWFLNSTLIDSTSGVRANQTTVPTVANELSVSRLTRDLLFSSLTCQSSNSNMTKSISTAVTIDIILRPLIANIMLPVGNYLSSGVKTEVICRTHGSRPAAHIRWFINGRDITNQSSESLYESNYSQSVLEFNPHRTHHRRRLVCRAANARLPNSFVEEAIALEVRYVPVMSLSLENSSQTAQRFIEGSEIALHCRIDANPNASVVRWTHNSLEIWHQTNGISNIIPLISLWMYLNILSRLGPVIVSSS